MLSSPGYLRGTFLVRGSESVAGKQLHGSAQLVLLWCHYIAAQWLSSRVVSVLDSGAEGPWFKSQPRCCRVTVLGKLFTPIVPLFTKQLNW